MCMCHGLTKIKYSEHICWGSMAEFLASSGICCITTGYTDIPLQNRVGIYNIDEKDISGVDMI
jgi:hypothetical protein